MKTKQWLGNVRLTTWWLDFSDLGWPDSHLTAKWEQRASLLREKNVNAVVLSGFHFRWNYVPIFERVFGALAEVTTICHQHELKVLERHSATRAHRARDERDRWQIHHKHPNQASFYPDDSDEVTYRNQKLADWRQISARDDQPVFLASDSSHIFCPNHPGFQEAYLHYIKRHLGAVPLDGILSEDLDFRPDFYSCSCPHCRQKFREETGLKLPSADETSFWGNIQNPDFLAWSSARYRWQAEHYQRLQAALPEDTLLAASAYSCISPGMAHIGFSPQLATEHFDAIIHEIPPERHFGVDEAEIVSELSGFASLARSQKKPLITLCHVDRPGDVAPWLHFLAQHQSRPWIEKQANRRDSIPEESLLEAGYNFERKKRKLPMESVQAIAFSEAFRDRLAPDEAELYVETYRQLSTELLARGSEPHLLFDNMWGTAAPEQWECLWLLDPRALNDEQTHLAEVWQGNGLAVGIS